METPGSVAVLKRNVTVMPLAKSNRQQLKHGSDGTEGTNRERSPESRANGVSVDCLMEIYSPIFVRRDWFQTSVRQLWRLDGEIMIN